MSKPQKFRTKPVVIEAMVLTEQNADAVARWCGGRVIREAKPSDPTDVYVGIDIPTLKGAKRASLRDAIIRGVNGDFYSCKPDAFDATYEPARTVAFVNHPAGDPSCRGCTP